MLSTVFNPCFDVLSGFLSAWNERGWIVKQGNLKSDYQIFLGRDKSRTGSTRIADLNNNSTIVHFLVFE